MSESLEEAITPNPDGLTADQKEFKEARKRLVKAYSRKAHWENRILRSRREVEVVLNRINGHLSSDQQVDYEKFLPPEAQLTSPRRITGSESIRLISDLQASLDAAKVRINALLDENHKLRSRLSERGRDSNSQVSRLDLIIGDLFQLKEKERELAKLDEDALLDTSTGYWADDEEVGDEQEAVEADGDGEAGEASPDGDMEMAEAGNDLEEAQSADARSTEQDKEQFSDGHSESTITPPPSLSLQAAADAETMENCSQ
ncbi:hypothetical protein FGB62_22g12 [Gracilaria domingensis]|nr:hypothetical protein FGB62_22g12 [Gracilaria domingensis]